MRAGKEKSRKGGGICDRAREGTATRTRRTDYRRARNDHEERARRTIETRSTTTRKLKYNREQTEGRKDHRKQPPGAKNV